MTSRTYVLYDYDRDENPVPIFQETQELTRRMNEWVFANALAEEMGVRNGHVAVMEDGVCIDKIRIDEY